MSDIQFDTNPEEFGRPPQAAPSADFTGKLVEWGLAADRQQAEYVMIGAVILILFVAGFLYFSLSGGSSAPPLLPQ